MSRKRDGIAASVVVAFATSTASAAALDDQPVPASDDTAPPARDTPSELGEHDTLRPVEPALNAVTFEALGPAVTYALEYERRIGDFAGRVGIGWMPIGSASSSSTESGGMTSLLSLPISVSYLGIGSERHRLELGGGINPVYESTPNHEDRGFHPIGSVFAGYRLQPRGSGFLFRVGIDALMELPRGGSEPTGQSSFPVLPWPYVALGETF